MSPRLPPGAAVAAVASALDRTPLAGATAFIEVPARQLTREVAVTIADRGYRAKVRTGGATADAFPDELTLARCLAAVTTARLAVKCTAGLHHAVRHRAADTGFEHHGFLNVLLAVNAALAGADEDEIAAELADTDGARVAAQAAGLSTDEAAAAREIFTSFGTCSTDEPVEDLVTLGLIIQDQVGKVWQPPGGKRPEEQHGPGGNMARHHPRSPVRAGSAALRLLFRRAPR